MNLQALMCMVCVTYCSENAKRKDKRRKKRKIKHLLDQSSKNIGGVQKQPGYFAY
jgi:hypothetical protein